MTICSNYARSFYVLFSEGFSDMYNVSPFLYIRIYRGRSRMATASTDFAYFRCFRNRHEMGKSIDISKVLRNVI